jgi:L-alanine-DL-glutamate epimerase-like enolase superfamily enzyme
MKDTLRIARLEVHRLAIPMRVTFQHAAATRSVADPVLVCLHSQPPGELRGWGETLARPYVTGETAASVAEDVQHSFAGRLAHLRAVSFADVLEFLDALPTHADGRPILAARAAVELALLDLAGRAFRRRPADVPGWMGLPGFGAPGALPRARYSGIVIGRSRAKLQWFLRLQRAYRLRDFKLKAALPGWEERCAWAARVLRPGLERGQATLRVDANGAWTLDQAVAAIPVLDACGVSALEQPLPASADADLPELAARGCCDVVADESLRTLADAERLLSSDAVRVLNVRLAKVGGLMPALRIAQRALAAGRDVQLGCLVGETSILTAAGIGFLECCPRVRFVEGAFGPRLLRQDVTLRPIRFGFGGRVRARHGFGLGLEVDEDAVHRLACQQAQVLPL